MKAQMVMVVVLGLFLGCADEYKPRPADQAEADKVRAQKAKADKIREAEPAPDPKTVTQDAAPKTAAPDPTDPKALAEARNLAILDQRFDDALRMCGKEDQNKLSEQEVFGCVLTACRKDDSVKAAQWSKNLKGKLLKEARKVCVANGTPL